MSGTDPSDGRVRTGIEILDRKLGGGIPQGSIVVLSATPASQSELFLYEFASAHTTIYLSTIRGETTVANTFANRGVDPETVETVRVGLESPVEDVHEIIENCPDRTNLIIDPMVTLEERENTRYRRLLDKLGTVAHDTGGVFYLHCLRDDYRPRRRRETLHVADLVLELSTEVRGDSVVNKLSVPKYRGGQSVEEVLKLDLTSEVEVDMSRNIV